MPQALNSDRAFVGFLLSAPSPALHTYPARYHCRHLYTNFLPLPPRATKERSLIVAAYCPVMPRPFRLGVPR